MKTTLHTMRQAPRVMVAGLILTLVPLMLSAQEAWRGARGFSQSQQTEQVKVRKVAQSSAKMSFEYTLPSANIKKSLQGQTVQQISLGSTPVRSRPGEPCIPVVPVQIILPAGTALDKATVRTGTPLELSGSYRIGHGQKPIALNGKGKKVYTDPDPAIYGSDAPYPAKKVEVVGIQKKRGVSIALVNIFPVVYQPRSGKVATYTSLTLDITLKQEKNAAASLRAPAPQPELFPAVENPEDFDTYLQMPAVESSGVQPLGLCNPAESFQYVIVTPDSFATATTDVTIRDLVTHKQARGITTTIVTIGQVYANYAGVDNAERLRNFIIDAYTNWETGFVLLGGDVNVIPMRKLYCNASGEVDEIPSDLYYQCLDGNYNSDNDSYWGETTDGPGGTDVDLMAELFIGRASAENKVEISNFVFKTLAYENASEAAPFLRRGLMVGEQLGFGGVSEYATGSMEEIRLGSSANGYSTVGFAASQLFTIDTLYDGPNYTWPVSEIIAHMNSGVYSLYNHLGHANYNYVMKFQNSDADALVNNNFFFAYSQGCIPGNFEADCVAEHLTTSNRHGAFAVVFNARYGWGQFNSTDGPSQRFHRQFWDAYFAEYMQNLGALNADSHEDNLWDINGECIRWCYYETNLLGDPQTAVRGLVDGPMVQYRSHTIEDAAGNSDGLVNPGETVNLRTTLTNVGSSAAAGVTMTLSTTDPYVTITDNSAAAGTIQCCGAVQPASDNLTVAVAANCPTPYTVNFTLTMRDNNNEIWTSPLSFTVYTSSQVSGYVRIARTGAALAGATVSFEGPVSGAVVTDNSGRYLFGGINGAYTVTAQASGYLASAPVSVTLPPSQTNVNFNLSRPLMDVTPDSLKETVLAGDSVTHEVTLSNSGDVPLVYSIAARDLTGTEVLPAEKIYSADHFLASAKGAPDTRLGKPVTLGRGGPDRFGYRWTDSDENGGPAFVWNDIKTTGTILSGISSCDDCSQSQPISFRFPFYGAEHQTIFVSSNGYITFVTGSTQYSNYALPSASMPTNLVAGFFDDLTTSGSGDVYFQDFGNKAIIQFDNVANLNGSGTYTYQIVIESSGSITFYYKTLTGNLTGTTVGIQNNAANDGLNIAYNTAYLKNDFAVRIRPVPDWLTVAPQNGTLQPGTSAELSVQMKSADLGGGGWYYGALEVTHNDPTRKNPETIPCTLYVDGLRRLAASPAELDFGTCRAGNRVTLSVTCTNSGDEPTAITAITSSAAQFTTGATLPLMVPAFGSRQIPVTFYPEAIGEVSGILTIASDAEDNPSISLPLSGSAVPAPAISVTPLSFSKQLAAGSTVSDILTIRNPGGDLLTYSITTAAPSIAAVSAPSRFATSDPSIFDPHGAAPSDAPGGLAVTYPFFDGFENGSWSNWTQGSGTYTRSVTSEMSASGVYSFTQIGGNNSHFDGVSVLFSSAVAPEEISFAVRTDSANGASGYVVFDQGGTLPFYFYLAPDGYMHIGQTLARTYQADVWYRIRLSVNWPARTYDFYVDGELVVNDQPFSNSVSSFSTIYVYNYYRAQAWWDNFNIGGVPEADWLTLSPVTGTVAPGASADIRVDFNSADMLGGTYEKEIRIASNAPGNELVTVQSELVVEGMKRLAVTPQNFTFPVIRSGENSSTTCTFTNDGNEATTITSITSSNPFFRVAATLPLTVPAFGTARTDVTFSPASVGTFSSTITISSDAEDNPTLQATLSGTATPPPVAQIEPAELSFTILPGGAPADQTAVLSNIGGAPLQYALAGVREVGSPLGKIATVKTAPQIRYDLIYDDKNYQNKFVPGRIIVAYKDGKLSLNDASLLASIGTVSVRNLATARSPQSGKTVTMARSLALLTIEGSKREDVLSAINILRNDANVAYAEPDYLVNRVGIPNDPSFAQLYGMHNSGQTGGTVDADIDAPEAWDTHTGNGSVLVGVIDTGIDYLHPDLAANIWTNPGEIAGNGIDDDGNGFIDDIHGWDFAYDDSNPMDGADHGTHCSGTIAGRGNNGIGVAGVMWQAKLVAIKFLDDDGSGTTSDAIDAVNYAAAMDIPITSNSWGGGGFSQALMDAIATQELFIAAAGNSSSNNDASPHYPSSYSLDNIVAVAATDNNDGLASFSCYGATSVDLGAPGVSIYSCIPNNSYGSMSGTSMATPHVAGAAGLIWTYNPMLTAADVKQILMSSADPKASLTGRTVSGGRLNVQKALEAAGPSWLAATPSQPGTLAPGEEVTFTVTVDPAGLAAGTWEGTVLINTDDPLRPQASIAVSATIPVCRSIAAAPASIDFGSSWAGSSRTENLTISNSCNSAVTISAITASGTGFSATAAVPLTVPAFGSITLPVVFSPTEVQNYTSLLSISSDAENQPVLTVALTGTCTTPPAISVTPASLSQDLAIGGTLTDTLFIRNTGGDILTFSIEGTQIEGAAAPAYSAEHLIAPVKGAADTRIGYPVPLGSGGPDQFGYRWIDSDQPGGPVYSWSSISGTGTMLSSVSSCDDCSQNVPLSFAFPFYGGNYSSMYVSSNGYITFGSGSSTFSNYPLPSTSMPANLISAFMDDLYPSSGGDIYFQDFGDSAIVQFNNVYYYSGSGSVTFQMILYRSGTIMFKFNSMSGTVSSSSTGIQNGSGTIGLNIAYNTTYVHNNLAVKITPAATWIKLGQLAGTVEPGSTVKIPTLFDATGVEPGQYLDTIRITHNAPSGSSLIKVPVELSADGTHRLSVTPAAYTFAPIWAGATAQTLLTLTNSGNEPTNVTALGSSSPVFAATASLPIVVPPGGSVVVPVTFTPGTAGNFTGTLTITSSAEDNPQLTVALAGSCILAPDIAVSPASFSVQLAPGASATRTLSVSNSGGADLEYNIAVDLLPADQLAVFSQSFATRRTAAIAARSLLNLPKEAGLSSSTEFAGITGEPVVEKMSVSPLANNNVLIFRDNLAWGYNVNVPILTSLGASVSIQTSSSMATVDLSLFDVIIFESQQPAAFYTRYAASIARFEEFLMRGGIISFHCATYSSYRLPNLTLPGGMRTLAVEQTAANNVVQLADHPIVSGSPATMTGSSASHEAFENIPNGASVIVRNSQGNPTLVEYNVGAGLLIATGMTWEHGYANNQSSGNPILPTALAYIINVALIPEWLTVSPVSGIVQGGDAENITLGFAAAGLPVGTYGATLTISHNVPLEPAVTIPVTLMVQAGGTGTVSMVTGIGVAASLKAGGAVYSLTDIKIGTPVTGLLRGSRYQLKLW